MTTTTPTFYKHDDRLNVMDLDEALKMDLDEFLVHFGQTEQEHRRHPYCAHCYDNYMIRSDDEEGYTLYLAWCERSNQDEEDYEGKGVQ